MGINFHHKIKSLFIVSASGFAMFTAVSIYKGNEKFYREVIMPVVHLLEPEKAHRFAVLASKYRLVPKSYFEDPDILKIKIFNKEFSNPVGIAAGFDKHAEAIIGLKDIGFGFIEVGSVTPEPQPGNEAPRVFRLSEDKAIINRYGFNSEGHEVVCQRLQLVRHEGHKAVIGVNLGKNKNSKDVIRDYVQGVTKFGPLADYLVINVSSPNTPGLRNLQNKKILKELLTALVKARDDLPVDEKPPLLLKLAPDLTDQDKRDIAEVVTQDKCKVDGLIICNTTVTRPEHLHKSNYVKEIGGLSGDPLKDMSTQMISDMYKLTKGMTIIGVGGISSGEDAYNKIKAGASMVQLYTALVYEGPPVVSKIKRELVELLVKDGYHNVAEAVGKGVI